MVSRGFFWPVFVNNVSDENVKLSEVQLVDRAAAGDRDARHALFERHRDAAYRVALRVAGRNEDALDVVQDAFIRAFERLGDFQRGASFKTWLLRIVSNRALDLLRARKVRLALPLDTRDDEPGRELPDVRRPHDPGAALEAGELRERLQRAIDTLPIDQLAVFALYATGEMTYGQIADVLGIPTGTVMSRLYHARRRLHEQLPDLAAAAGQQPRNA